MTSTLTAQQALDLINQLVLPDSVGRSPFLRIDCPWDIEQEKYILSEIEGAGAARLWLKEAGRVQDYSQMLITEAVKPARSAFCEPKTHPQPQVA
jgi:hypothetical protein